MWSLAGIINLLFLPALAGLGFLTGRVRHGWLKIPGVTAAAPLFFTLIGTFDDGEGLLWRLATGFIFGIPIGLGWLGAKFADKRDQAERPA